MLESAWRQFRHALALVGNRRVRISDLYGLVADMVDTKKEFGRLDRETLLEALGKTLDPQVREVNDARRWKQTVTKAYQHTLYYRQTLDRLGIRPDELTLDRRAELPPPPSPRCGFFRRRSSVTAPRR